MFDALFKALGRYWSSWFQTADGRIKVILDRPNRLALTEGGWRTHWLTVTTDGTLQNGVVIDLATMNATDPALLDEEMDVRLKRARLVQGFLRNRGWPCEVLDEDKLI